MPTNPLDTLVSLSHDVRAHTGNTLANEMLDAIGAARERETWLRNALIDARASFLGLQPDFGGPIAAQMGNAVKRINDVLDTP